MAMTWSEVALTVLCGLLVTGVGWLARQLWISGKVPEVLSRSVRRDAYLGEVLKESSKADLIKLDVIAPRLTSAGDSEKMTKIQTAWERINGAEGGRVRVITLDSDDCIMGGAELLKDGIEVRMARRDLGTDSMSYHLFESSHQGPTVIINHHLESKDRPVRMTGSSPADMVRQIFETKWRTAVPLESVIADKIIELAGRRAGKAEVLKRFGEVQARLNLDSRCAEKVLPQLAFRHDCVAIFIVGMPGAGKSLIRAKLAVMLDERHIENQSFSDYPFAYRDFLHSQLLLAPHQNGFAPHAGGAFTVQEESSLIPALRSLAQAVRTGNDGAVKLIEFARSDLVNALHVFDELRARSRVIYVSAEPGLRHSRLNRRAEPPESQVEGTCITLKLSDNHLLPSGAERALYQEGDVAQLKKNKKWRDRITEIENNHDDDPAHLDLALRAFIDQIGAEYSAPLGGQVR